MNTPKFEEKFNTLIDDVKSINKSVNKIDDSGQGVNKENVERAK